MKFKALKFSKSFGAFFYFDIIHIQEKESKVQKQLLTGMVHLAKPIRATFKLKEIVLTPKTRGNQRLKGFQQIEAIYTSTDDFGYHDINLRSDKTGREMTRRFQQRTFQLARQNKLKVPEYRHCLTNLSFSKDQKADAITICSVKIWVLLN